MATRKIIPLAAVAASVASLVWLFSMTGHGGDPAHATAIVLDQPHPAPSFLLSDLDGQPLSAETLRGRIVVLDVWATWCAPCLSEVPGFNELRRQMSERGVEIIGVTVGSGNAESVRRFSAGADPAFDYPLLMGDAEFERTFGPLWGLPTTILIDRDWQIRKRWLGAREGKQLEIRALVEQLLAARD